MSKPTHVLMVHEKTKGEWLCPLGHVARAKEKGFRLVEDPKSEKAAKAPAPSNTGD